MFYKVKIHTIEHLTPQSVRIEFAIPAEHRSQFLFQAGQYLVIRIPTIDPFAHRSYSICSAPYEQMIAIGVKRVEGGKISTYLCSQAKQGDEIELMSPQGNFILPENMELKSVVAFVSGSGITPVISIIKELLQKNQAKVALFYGNKYRSEIMFDQELKSLENTYATRFEVNHILSREQMGLPDFEGRISSEKLERWKSYLFDAGATDAFLLCGPGNMVHHLEATLLSYHISSSKIYTELFSSPVEPETKPTIEAKSQSYFLEYKLNNKWKTIEVQSNADVLLEIGTQHGLDLPYSCKSGVCSTCQAKLIEGSVTMDNNYVLSDTEIKQGYILTCQSHATASKLKIDYDMR